MFTASLIAAWLAWVLLVATLLVGPTVARGGRTPASLRGRRRLGILAGALGLAHAWLGTSHSMSAAYLAGLDAAGALGTPGATRRVFGAAAVLGLIAAAAVLVPLALSNDFALRRLGSRRWKALQRTTWLYFAVVAAHGVMFQFIETRPGPAMAVFAGLGALPLLARWPRHR